jgi:hypothetical protein
MTLTQHEWRLLEESCAAVPPMAVPPAVGTDRDYPDFITNLFLTVLDLRLMNPIVNRAITYYRNNHWEEVRTLEDLERVLTRFPNDPATERQPSISGDTRTVSAWGGYEGSYDGREKWALQTKIACEPGRMRATSNGTSLRGRRA